MTAINSLVGSTLADILAINTEVEALLASAKTKRQAAVQPFLDALAASGEVSIIAIRGYTPGFNDGEPCTHSAEFYVNVKAIIGDEVLESLGDGLELGDWTEDIEAEEGWDTGYKKRVFDQAKLDANIQLCKDHGHVYLEPSRDVMSAIDTLLFTNAEEEFGTDYYVVYILKDGKFERTDGEYSAGY